MANSSLLTLVKRLETDVRLALRRVDVSHFSRGQKEQLSQLNQYLLDARRYTEAYELSETRQQQIEASRFAKRWLKSAGKNILSISESSVFSAADVADLSAQIGQIIAGLK